MLPLQVNATFSVASGIGAVSAPNSTSALPSDSQNLLSPQRGGESPSNAVQPGPPISRLEFRTQNQSQDQSGEAGSASANGAPAEASQTTNANGEKVDENGLTEAEQRQVEKLKARDREVKAHERAHAVAGGSNAGSPSYTFTTGPDGKQYAVGGEVSIDVSPVPGNPQATIRKMEQVKRAALAPSNPSGQDRRVASQAEGQIIAARQEIAAEKREEQAKQAEKRTEREAGETDAIGQTDPVFNPQERFRQPVGAVGGSFGTGLAGQGELSMDTGVLSPSEMFNIVA